MTPLERARADAAAREVPWDDVRERRVLAHLKQARKVQSERAGRRWAWLTPPRLGLGVALAGTAAALALVFALAPGSNTRDQAIVDKPTLESNASKRIVDPANTNPATIEAPLESGNSATPHQDGSRMRLPDGSLAVLGPGAQLQVIDLDSESGKRIALEQSAGEVRYEVSPNAAREFVVRSKGVKIRVIGTIFTVVAGDVRVSIEVERGRVEVIADERRSELGPGDSLGVHLDTLGSQPAAPLQAAPRTKPSVPEIEELLSRVDAARLAGEDAKAAKLLAKALREHPDDPRATTAAFTLGRVERGRGRHREAARAFARYLERSPHGVLAEDAWAEQARSWADAGDRERARAAASSYLARWANGTHAERMRELAAE